LDNVDDSGGISPSLVLPIGTLQTNVMELIAESGISGDLLEIGDDTIYIVYRDVLSLNPLSPIPGLVSDGVIDYIPDGLRFTFDNGSADVDIDVFDALTSSGNALYPTRPRLRLTIRNYIGSDIDIDVNEITSYGADNQQKVAVFDNGSTSYSIHAGSAPAPYQHSVSTETFDRDNGGLHELFIIAPDRLSYDFSIDLSVPDDNRPHFIVDGKYVELEYEVRIPLTFGAGTQLSNADTLDFDLSGNSLVNDLNGLTLWIDYENSIPTTVGLEVLFLDKSKREIPGIGRSFTMNAPAVTREAITAPNGLTAQGSFVFQFNNSELETADLARYAVLKTALKVGSGEVNIRPENNVKLKLSAYSKVNI
jgi:hypothetical protein